MAITAPENAVIVRIVKHVISTQGNVINMGVRCQVINLPSVMVSKQMEESANLYSSLLIL